MCECCSRVPYASLLALIVGVGSAVTWGIYAHSAVSDTLNVAALSNLSTQFNKVMI